MFRVWMHAQAFQKVRKPAIWILDFVLLPCSFVPCVCVCVRVCVRGGSGGVQMARTDRTNIEL